MTALVASIAAVALYRDPLSRRGAARVRAAKRADPRLREALEGGGAA